MIRPQAVVLPILREALPGVSVVSVVPDIDHRTFPLVVVQRDGGTRLPSWPQRFSLPVLEMTAVAADCPVAADELYEATLDALYDAVRQQEIVPGVGYLHSVRESQGATQTASDWPVTWAVEGAVRLGLRSHR